MTAYIIRRIVLALIVLVMVSLMVFLAMRLLPGDPILIRLTKSQTAEYTVEQLELLRHEYGLDKPLYVQYGEWMGGVLRGDLGVSILYGDTVSSQIGGCWTKTLYIGLVSFILGFILGVPAGIICAVRRGGWLDNVVSILANIGITIPVFWLGILLMYLLALELKLLPMMGYTSPFDDFWMSTKQIIMPVICITIGPLAMNARQTRSSMLEVLSQDYVRTAWSKGLKERAIIIRHALKNALIPVVTLTGMGISSIIGGQVLIETVFNISGMGRLMVSAIQGQDYAVVQGITLIIAAVIVVANLIIDISYGWIDPRIRYQ
jgi:peptide/nickel transport system permease protein